MTPAQALATVLARLLRRRRAASDAAVHPNQPQRRRGKAIHIYPDKSRQAGWDYETKTPGGTIPHG